VATTSEPNVEMQRDALIERLLAATNGVWDILTVYLGDRLGLYRRLVELGSATSIELAAATNLSERYVREWLEQQTVTGILSLDNPGAAAAERRFRLPAGHAEVLTERDSLNYLAPLAQLTVGVMSPLQRVVESFRTGGGVPYADYGKDMHEGQAGMNRNLFLYQLGPDYLAAIPDVDARLSSNTPAKVADLGCGFGYSSIGIARHYPNARVDGFDLDEISVSAAQPLLQEHGVADRVKI
jgi:hypothetical protein